MWKDMGLYLAWRSNNLCDATPPTKKEIQYAEISLPAGKMRLAVTVFDDGSPREVNRAELARLVASGAAIENDIDIYRRNATLSSTSALATK